MAFVRKEDCPSILDNIRQALEAMFSGEYTTWLVALVILFIQEKVILWKAYSELQHFKAHVNAPFLHKTNSKIYHHSWIQWLTCSWCHSCLRNNSFFLQTLKNAKVKGILSIMHLFPPLPSATHTLDLQHQWQSFSWASHIRGKKKFGEFQSCEMQFLKNIYKSKFHCLSLEL